MRSLTRRLLTETPRSTWEQFQIDFTNGVIAASLILIPFLLSAH